MGISVGYAVDTGEMAGPTVSVALVDLAVFVSCELTRQFLGILASMQKAIEPTDEIMNNQRIG